MDGDEDEEDFDDEFGWDFSEEYERDFDEDQDAPCVYTRRAEAAAQAAKAAALTTGRHKVRPALHTVDENESPKHQRVREASKRHKHQLQHELAADIHHIYDRDDSDSEEPPLRTLNARS